MATSNDTRVRVDGLLEDHGERLAGERVLDALRRRSAFKARLVSIMPRRSALRDVGQIEEMANAVRAHPAAPCFARMQRRGDAGAGAVDARERFRDLGLADDQRRQEAHHVVAGRHRNHLLGAQLVHELRARHYRAQADQQSLAAHLGDDLRDSGP